MKGVNGYRENITDEKLLSLDKKSRFVNYEFINDEYVRRLNITINIHYFSLHAKKEPGLQLVLHSFIFPLSILSIYPLF